jgi:hypothetical protein
VQQTWSNSAQANQVGTSTLREMLIAYSITGP